MDHFGWLEALPGHDRRVPIAGPAFVHDLGLALRGEVVGFVADDRQHIELPGLERGVFEHEQHDVALGLVGELHFARFAQPALVGDVGRQMPWAD